SQNSITPRLTPSPKPQAATENSLARQLRRSLWRIRGESRENRANSVRFGLNYANLRRTSPKAPRRPNMDFVVLKHLSGSKANQEDKYPLDQFKEIILGRDLSSTVSFNEETEAMVGRQHARITRNPALPSLFLITDLDSRNGTFVNQQRIAGTVSLKPGDV